MPTLEDDAIDLTDPEQRAGVPVGATRWTTVERLGNQTRVRLGLRRVTRDSTTWMAQVWSDAFGGGNTAEVGIADSSAGGIARARGLDYQEAVRRSIEWAREKQRSGFGLGR